MSLIDSDGGYLSDSQVSVEPGQNIHNVMQASQIERLTTSKLLSLARQIAIGMVREYIHIRSTDHYMYIVCCIYFLGGMKYCLKSGTNVL